MLRRFIFLFSLFPVLSLYQAKAEDHYVISAVEDFTAPKSQQWYVPFYEETRAEDKNLHGLAVRSNLYPARPSAAEYTFKGESGSYQIQLEAVAEEDGQSFYEVWLNSEYLGTRRTQPVLEKRVPQKLDYGIREIEPEDVIRVVFYSHTNMQIPEHDGYAWSRGRWRNLHLTAHPAIPENLAEAEAIQVWETLEVDLAGYANVSRVELTDPWMDSYELPVDNIGSDTPVVRFLPNKSGRYGLKIYNQDGQLLDLLSYEAHFFKFSGPLSKRSAYPWRFTDAFDRSKNLFGYVIPSDFFNQDNLEKEFRELTHLKELGGQVLLMQDFEFETSSWVSEGEIVWSEIRKDMDAFLAKTAFLLRRDLDLVILGQPTANLKETLGEKSYDEVREYLKLRFSNISYLSIPELFEDPFGGDLPFYPPISQRFIADNPFQDAIILHSYQETLPGDVSETIASHFLQGKVVLVDYQNPHKNDLIAKIATTNQWVGTFQKDNILPAEYAEKAVSEWASTGVDEPGYIGQGSYPDLTIDSAGIMHITYAREGKGYYRTKDSRGLSEEAFTGITYTGGLQDGPQRSDPEIAIGAEGEVFVLIANTLSRKSGGKWQVLSTEVGRDTSMVTDSRGNLFINKRGGFHGGHVGLWVLPAGQDVLQPVTKDPDTGTEQGNDWLGGDHPYGQLFVGQDDALYLTYRQGKPDYIAWRNTQDIGQTWTGGGVYGGVTWQSEASNGVVASGSVPVVIGPVGHVFAILHGADEFKFLGRALSCGSRDLPDILSTQTGAVVFAAFGGKYSLFANGGFSEENYLISPDNEPVGFVALAENPVDSGIWAIYETGANLNKEQLSGTSKIWLTQLPMSE